ncbi:MAG TPA: hypothetical protein VJI66_03160 [Candidatus Paceibacterota bacterium]
MQQNKPKSKGTAIALIVIIIIALFLYFYYKGSPDTDTASSLESSNIEGLEDAQVIGSRVLILLNQINALKIDASVFNSAIYESLVDYTIAIPEQPVGRPNPFAPVR